MKELIKDSRKFNFKEGNICNIYGKCHKITRYDRDLINTMQTDAYQPIVLNEILLKSLGFKIDSSYQKRFTKRLGPITIMQLILEDTYASTNLEENGQSYNYIFLKGKFFYHLQNLLNHYNKIITKQLKDS